MTYLDVLVEILDTYTTKSKYVVLSTRGVDRVRAVENADRMVKEMNEKDNDKLIMAVAYGPAGSLDHWLDGRLNG